QIRATRGEYNRSGNLRVQVTRDIMAKLIAYPVPTYIIGVDSSSKRSSFLVAAVAGGPTHYPSLPTTHQLNEQALRRLYDEVLAFWQAHAATFATSLFV